MAYTPNPTDPTAPLGSDLAGYMAAEFRALKGYIQSVVAGDGGGSGSEAGNNFAYSGSYRNRLYNGTFLVQQRFPTDTTVAAGTTEFVADRWQVASTGADTLCQPLQSGTLDGDTYLVMDMDTGVTELQLLQRIESADCKDLKSGASVTISGMLYYSTLVPDNPTIALETPTTTNDDYGTTTEIGTAILVPIGLPYFVENTWTFFKLTIPLTGNAYKGLQFRIDWQGLYGGNFSIRMSRIQLEIGAWNTPYERVPLSIEYLRCRRFYQQNDTTLKFTAQAAGDLSSAYFSLGPMFTAPTVTYVDTGLVNGIHAGEEVVNNTCISYIEASASGQVVAAFSVLLDAEI